MEDKIDFFNNLFRISHSPSTFGMALTNVFAPGNTINIFEGVSAPALKTKGNEVLILVNDMDDVSIGRSIDDRFHREIGFAIHLFLQDLGIDLTTFALTDLYIYLSASKDKRDMNLFYDQHLKDRYLSSENKKECLFASMLMQYLCVRFARDMEAGGFTVEFGRINGINDISLRVRFKREYAESNYIDTIYFDIHRELKLEYKQLPFVQIENETECCVCYTKEKPISIKCSDVSHNICFVCLEKIDNKKCPLCRSIFGIDQLVRHTLTHDEKKKKRKNAKQREKKANQ
jgi:hypothetical protein